jgi:hypothetical protein
MLTKGQTEFLVAIGVVAIGLAIAGTEIYINKTLPEPVKPIETPLIIQNGLPTPAVSNTPDTTMAHCDVLNDIHVNMYKDTVLHLCGKPDIIDTTSAKVKRVEKVFKADEIWYYLSQKMSVEITDGWVTAISAISESIIPSTPVPTPTP